MHRGDSPILVIFTTKGSLFFYESIVFVGMDRNRSKRRINSYQERKCWIYLG